MFEYGALFKGYLIDWVDYNPNSFDWPTDLHLSQLLKQLLDKVEIKPFFLYVSFNFSIRTLIIVADII